MSKPPERRSCVIPGCMLTALAGSARCSDHQLKPETLRDAISAGPKWDAIKPLSSVELGACVACGDLVQWISASTGLCKVCWRLWRFAQATTPVRGPLLH